MNRRPLALCSTAALVSMAAAPASQPASQPASPSTLAAHGFAAVDLTRDRMYLPASGLYVQDIQPGEAGYKPEGADCWSIGVQLTALTAAARLDPGKYGPWVRQYVDAIDRGYWSDANGIGGYDDGPHPKPPDRYYDDNAWIALGLVEAYEVTHEPRDLARAADTLKYVLSGEDDKLGGGLYWRENPKASKNTCSNAPGLAAAVRVYTYTRDPAQLAAAVRLYRWTVAHLRDEHDGLYFDNLTVAGQLSKTKFTYNTALMIRGGCLLYDATGDAAYLHDAQRSAAAAVAKWVDPATGAIRDPSYFAHLLAESLLDLSARDHDARWAAVDRAAAAEVWQAEASPAGFYPEHWGDPRHQRRGVDRLINQASAARLLLRAAWPDVPPPKVR